MHGRRSPRWPRIILDLTGSSSAIAPHRLPRIPVGLPVPEESILVLAGYLTWQGKLRLPLVCVVDILSGWPGTISAIGSDDDSRAGHAGSSYAVA